MISLRSKIVQKLLGYFFLHEASSLYVNEMSRSLGLDRGNLIKMLRSLEAEGILKSEYRGNQKYFSLNKKFSLLREYRNIILKTVGFEKNIRELLRGVNGVKSAYIFGSYAKDKMDSLSDIDLLAVGQQDTIELQKKISKLQKQIDREINVVSMGEEEFRRKIKKGDSFIAGILGSANIKLL